MKLLLPSQIVAHLEKSASSLRAELERVESAIRALSGGAELGRPHGTKRKPKISKAGRAAIARAQRERWAKLKAAKKQ